MSDSNTSSSKAWIAAYLFYAEADWNEFINNAVRPFVDLVCKDGVIEHFFFIRYWENGPHIRLRFKVGDPAIAVGLISQLKTYFQLYFMQNPSESSLSTKKQLVDSRFFYPNNSIQFVEYVPEIERYGGQVGILIAEQQFEASSRAVLSIITNGLYQEYDYMLGKAIQLHLGFIYTTGMSMDDALRYFESSLRDHLQTDQDEEDPLLENKLGDVTQKVLNAFEESFISQKHKLVPYVRGLWSAFEEGVLFEDDWLNLWLVEMKNINEALRSAYINDLLLIPNQVKLQVKDGACVIEDLWFIFRSYIHMTNNRLGIKNHDEVFLNYILVNSLVSLKK